MKEASSAFNIQLDNLCQFLPQDMVVEFAKCDSKKLLEQTQKAIGSEDMIQVFGWVAHTNNSNICIKYFISEITSF